MMSSSTSEHETVIWTIATRKEHVSYEEMQRRLSEQMSG